MLRRRQYVILRETWRYRSTGTNSRRTLLGVLMCTSALLAVNPSHGQEANWIGGTSNDWFDGANWDTGFVPAPFVSVVIDSPSGHLPAIQTPGALGEYLTVGRTGPGYLTLSGSGTLDNLSAVLGDLDGSHGIAELSGSGVNWTVSELLAVGYKGTGWLSIKSGAVVNSRWANIGEAADAGSKATVTGPGSTWVNAENIFVGAAPVIGSAGAGGTGELEILNGGMAVNQNGVIGRITGSRGMVTVSDIGSTWTNTEDLYVGFGGVGSLTVQAGGTVVNERGVIGQQTEAGGSVTVTDGGSTWTNNGFLLVGAQGAGTLTIENGGEVVSNSQVRIGEDPTSVGAATVTGPGSQWNNSSQFAVGFWGDGSLLIENGASVSGASYTSIATWDDSQGEVTVTGGGAAWDNTGELHVGRRGAGILSIEDGAFVGSGQSSIGSETGANGAVTLAGRGTGWTVGGDLIVGHEGIGSLNIGAETTVIASGLVSVADQLGSSGSLLVNGAISGSSIQVHAGGWLGGAGAINGNTSMAGTVAPGSSIGTLTVTGNYTQRPDSIYEVELDDTGASDLITVSGTAMIEGGGVNVVPLGGYLLDHDYTILTASGGVSGMFDEASMTSTFAFLSPELSYDANSAFLRLVERAPLPSVAWTRNQKAAAEGIDSLGRGTPVWDAIIVLDADSARSAFDALSGEIHGSARTALVEDSRFVRNAANDRLRAAFSATGAAYTPVLAYGPDDTPMVVAADHTGPVFWSHGFGSWGSTDSDGNAASLDRSTGGLLIGADGLVGDWRVGLLAGYSRSNFDAQSRTSSGSSDNYHLGLYGGTGWGDIAFRTGAAYTWHDIDTHRSVTIPGLTDNLSSDYSAGTFQAFGELGYGIEIGDTRFEPFANLAHVSLHTDGFTEQGGATALSGRSGTTDVTFTTLGLRGEHVVTLGRTEATLRGMLGWRHAFGDATPESTHGLSAGDAFTIAGAPIARNSAVIEAGLDLNLTPDATFGLSYAGQIASDAHDHGFKATLGVRF